MSAQKHTLILGTLEDCHTGERGTARRSTRGVTILWDRLDAADEKAVVENFSIPEYKAAMFEAGRFGPP